MEKKNKQNKFNSNSSFYNSGIYERAELVRNESHFAWSFHTDQLWWTLTCQCARLIIKMGRKVVLHNTIWNISTETFIGAWSNTWMAISHMWCFYTVHKNDACNPVTVFFGTKKCKWIFISPTRHTSAAHSKTNETWISEKSEVKFPEEITYVSERRAW